MAQDIAPWVPLDLHTQLDVFERWLTRQTDVRKCRGVPNTHPVLRDFGGEIHTTCCIRPFMLALPPGEDIETVLTRWARQAAPGTVALIADYCLDQKRAKRKALARRPLSTFRRELLDQWTANRAFWLGLQRELAAAA